MVFTIDYRINLLNLNLQASELNMSLPIEKFREIVVAVVFAYEYGDQSEETLISALMELLSVTKKNVCLAIEQAKKVIEQQPVIDQHLRELSENFEFERIGKAELAVLRVCMYSILHEKEIPAKAMISEGIRLGKKFSSQDSAKFINAILDTFSKKQEPTPQ